MFKPIAAASLAALIVISAAAPALALNCSSGGSGARFGFGLSFGKKMTESEKAEFALMELRRRGVDATRVEFWGTCLRAFVRRSGGHEAMEFYDPDTLDRVY